MHNFIKKILVFLILSILSILNVSARNFEFSSGKHQNTLIELFTSQGCNSCPPADEWLNNFKDNPKLFKEIIPMAFHVDYWDYLDWKDSFSKSDYSDRQKAHYDLGHLAQVYTPAILKNNKEVKRESLYNKNVSAKKIVGNLSVQVFGKNVFVRFKSTNKTKNLTANIALLGVGFEEKIHFGENKGKRLMHDFVVLSHQQKRAKGNSNTWIMDLPSSKIKAKKYAVAVWLTEKNLLDPVQITADWL